MKRKIHDSVTEASETDSFLAATEIPISTKLRGVAKAFESCEGLCLAVTIMFQPKASESCEGFSKGWQEINCRLAATNSIAADTFFGTSPSTVRLGGSFLPANK